MAAAEHTNRLAAETSPYLRQHMHNPVDWYPWGEEAFRKAREEGRPILLSVGYSACHWCHVMERESFENEEIAALMNRWFINVKVDREERPDVDQIYMAAVQLMTGQGGWPMTVFLTPDGKPFYGGTYYPPHDMYGRPGFPRVLEAVAEAWQNRRSEIEEQSRLMVEEIRRSTDFAATPSPITPDLFDRAFRSLQESFDERYGGFGGAPKFPQPMALDFLMRYARRTGRSEPLRMVERTLEEMALGGIYDQLGGGFHRYSTDARWLVPHFEKMLYDNAQLAHTFLRAWLITEKPLYRRIVEETLDYVLREMTHPEGGFYSSQDADSEGEEGRFFVWTPGEVEAAVGKEEAGLFARLFDVTPEGNWEGRSILHVQNPSDPFLDEPRIAEIKKRLFEYREQRIRPGRDEKVLVSWNGLMLAAMADAGAVLNRKDYLSAAGRTADFLVQTMYRDGLLMRTGKHQGGAFQIAPIPGFLEDYAFLADGLLRLYEATFDLRWLTTARVLADSLLERFWVEGEGFYDTPSDGEALPVRPRDLSDNAIPAGSSVGADVLLRMAHIFAQPDYSRPAVDVLRRAASALERHPLAFGRLLCAADFYAGPVRELAIVGPAEHPGTDALAAAARSGYYPNLLMLHADSADSEAMALPVMEGREAAEGRPTAYLCENYACRMPVTEPDELKRQLES